jgi:RNase P subunit RPR2
LKTRSSKCEVACGEGDEIGASWKQDFCRQLQQILFIKKKIRSRFREMTITRVMKKLRETGEAQQSGCSLAGDIIQVPQFLS